MAPEPVTGKNERQRAFFALWPPQAVQERLARIAGEYARKCGGRPQRAANIHLTLAFLGALRPEQIKAVSAMADALPFVPFRLVLDRVGWFRRSGILWAGCRQDPPALAQLAAELGARLRRSGFRVEERPFRSHLTLLRHARAFPRLSLEAIGWDVDDFCLVISMLDRDGARYQRLDQWPQSARTLGTNLG